MKQKPGKVITHRQTGLFGEMAEVKPPIVFDQMAAVRQRCWAQGKVTIRELTGTSERQAAVLVGKLLKVAHDDCALLLKVFSDAMDLRPVEPMPWLMKTAKVRANDRAAVQRISDDWDLVGIEDLDANAARLMARDAAAPATEPLAIEFSAGLGD